MITGQVTTNIEAVIELDVAGPARQRRRVEPVIDTGYNGELTLPDEAVQALELPFAGYRQATLADNSIVTLSVFLATVIWHGQAREVVVVQADGAPLIGMALLRGSRMTMDVIEEGPVIIDELP